MVLALVCFVVQADGGSEVPAGTSNAVRGIIVVDVLGVGRIYCVRLLHQQRARNRTGVAIT